MMPSLFWILASKCYFYVTKNSWNGQYWNFLFSNVVGITNHQAIINALFYNVVEIVQLKKVTLVFKTPISKVFK